jgi:hypothetical protein
VNAGPPRRRPPATIASVSLLWYPVALVPILILAAVSLVGWLPVVIFPVALFLFIFWVSSLGFAIYAKTRKRPEPRQ